MIWSKAPVLSLSRLVLVALVVCLFQVSLTAQPFAGGRVLDKKLYHLGDDIVDLWPGISPEPEGDRLTVRFQAKKNQKEHVVTLTYWDVNYPAKVELNGKPLESLAPSQKRIETFILLPAGSLKDGANTLVIIPEPKDDCVVGKVVLHEQTYRELMNLQTVTLKVLDQKSKSALPARVTITDPKGKLQKIFFAPTNSVAVRDGLIYVPAAETSFELPEGDYVFYATRGFEWSMDKQSVSIRSGTNLTLRIRQEVDTKGFVSCDTHLHTLTHSGHGDASVDERVLTVAGEGIALAIATDHNHNTDYRPAQQKLGLSRYYTSVTGNEVSTKTGHFNAFPMEPGATVPNQRETNWVKVVDDMRMHGAKVIILNHPRWARMDAYEMQGMNPLTGERGSGMPITFDAMELANSGAALKDKMQLFEDWFAFLNYGEDLKAVGSSDSHGVTPIVGQGRTYIRSTATAPSKIDVDEACAAMVRGDMSVSLGLFADVVVNDKYKMGQTVPVKGSSIKVRMRVAAPSWATPERAIVFLNGAPVAEQELTPKPGKPFNEYITFDIPTPRHDAHLICAVFGPGITEPAWKTKQNYTLAATNPIYLDADNDGTYRSPRETATRVLSKTSKSLDDQWRVAMEADDGVAVQMIDRILKTADAATKQQLITRLQSASAERKVFGKLLKTHPLAQLETAGK
ncbi:MAG: CehA/McbA family metallohydrolase [Limisphaerales bacterium]